MNEPHVVDLRVNDDHAADPTSERDPRGRWLSGLGLLVVGGLIGWLLALPADDAEEPPVAAPVPTATAVPAPPASAGIAVEAAPADPEFVGRAGPRRVPSVEAGLEPLAGITSLAGPVTLVSGFVSNAGIRFLPDGSVALVVVPSGIAAPTASGQLFGYPVGEVDAGVLFIPTDSALGAVAYWTPERGVALPLPDAPYDTSFLAAAGSLGVFLSDGDVVVRDLVAGQTLLRTAGAVDGAPVVHACLSPSGEAIALVADTGAIVVVAIETGAVSAQLETSTPRFGVAWPSGGQLARLVGTLDAEVVVATDLATGTDHEVARLDATGAWKLNTAGTGC